MEKLICECLCNTTSALTKVVDVAEKSEWETIKTGFEIGLVVLVVVLVIIGLIIGFNKLKSADDEDEGFGGDTYY